jgi:hypoxanthine phosphoribosyltransferase
LGAEISEDHPEGVVLVGVLPGVIPFLSDLSRHITVCLEVDFLAITPYTPGTGRVQLSLDLHLDLHGRPTVVVDELVDTGLTLNHVLNELAVRTPSSLRACALVDRTRRRLLPVEIAYRGIESDEDFLLGYGLGRRGGYANLPALLGAEPADVEAEGRTAGPFWARAAGLARRGGG